MIDLTLSDPAHLTPADVLRLAGPILADLQARLPAHPGLRLLANAAAWHTRHAAPATVTFEFGYPMRADGIALPVRCKGIGIAWLALAARQYDLPPVPFAALGFASHNGVRMSLDRAAEKVEPVSRPLARAIHSCTTSQGRIVARDVPVRCTSPLLADFARRVTSALPAG